MAHHDIRNRNIISVVKKNGKIDERLGRIITVPEVSGRDILTVCNEYNRIACLTNETDLVYHYYTLDDD